MTTGTSSPVVSGEVVPNRDRWRATPLERGTTVFRRGQTVQLQATPYGTATIGVLQNEGREGVYGVWTLLVDGNLFRSEGRLYPEDLRRCDCTNPLSPDDPYNGLCEHCDSVKDEPPHVGHAAHFTGAWWCDTCNSPLCNLI